MKDTQNWFIVEIKTSRPVCGYLNNSMIFSSGAIAEEVACQLFQNKAEYILVEIPDFERSKK